MPRNLEVLFTPAEFATLGARDLSSTTCVVFDVLRATSTMVTALANGAAAIVPVAEISEALAIRHRDPQVLLAGERDGVRIRADLTGGVDFDLGNSPREHTREKVAGRIIVSTTTNGTRALRAASRAKLALVSSFLNLQATADFLLRSKPLELLLICSGTYEGAALEDSLAAGALCDMLWQQFSPDQIHDSAQMARRIFLNAKSNLAEAMSGSWNARRLSAISELKADVPFCLQRDFFNLVAVLEKDGAIRKLKPAYTIDDSTRSRCRADCCLVGSPPQPAVGTVVK
jgi:2-phosphosulfolactate phosphatase